MTLPPTCFIAVENEKVLGFSCYDTVARGVYGPVGVLESARGRGIGRVMLVASLRAMKEHSYVYAIIGRVGPTEFYTQAVGAIVIENSDPGMAAGLLRE